MTYSPNLHKMLQLSEAVFNAKADARQIAFTPQDMQHLSSIHPLTLNEKSNEDGPICWVTIIPTSLDIMKQFLSGEIHEKELLNLTHSKTAFEAIYLCSALTLPEYRNQHITFKLALDSIQNIAKDAEIQYLFAWPFSKEGKSLCDKISKATGISLLTFESPKTSFSLLQ
jgi:hypothetical protein